MPASLMRFAAQPPDAPEPTTMASYSSGRGSRCLFTFGILGGLEFAALYCDANANEKGIVMSDVKSEGPLRHFRVGRRTVLQSLATGVGAAMFASGAAAEHVHVASTAPVADDAAANTANAGLQFLDRHAFDTLALLSEQIVPGSRSAQVAEFLDRLLAVESTDTQRSFMQALGAFEAEARAANS